MNFELDDEEVRLANLNVRVEKHGDEDATAIDLKLQWQTSNEALLKFHPELRKALYFVPDQKQRAVDGVEPLMSRLFPDLGPLKWRNEQAAMKLTIHHGLGGKSDLVLPDCTVDKFVIEPLEGGTVDISLRVQCVCEEEKILGKLATLLHHDMPVTLKHTEGGERQKDMTKEAATA